MQKPVLSLLGVTDEVNDKTLEVLIKTIPAMALRAITDSSKSMIQGAGNIKVLGTLSFFNILVFCGYSYFFIVTLNLETDGYCLAIFMYEFSSLLICVVFYFFIIHKGIRDCSIGILTNLGWYSCEVLKLVSSIMYSFISTESLLFILTYANQEE